MKPLYKPSRTAGLGRTCVRGLVSGAVLLRPLMAAACPLCDTESGQQVRAGIFNEEFWTTLLVVASPFPVLLLGIAAYHFGWPPFSAIPLSSTSGENANKPSTTAYHES